MRTALFWVITLRIVVILYLRFGTIKKEPIGCPETSVRNDYYWLRNNPEERSSHN